MRGFLLPETESDGLDGGDEAYDDEDETEDEGEE